jgi:hypothetical protein
MNFRDQLEKYVAPSESVPPFEGTFVLRGYAQIRVSEVSCERVSINTTLANKFNAYDLREAAEFFTLLADALDKRNGVK